MPTVISEAAREARLRRLAWREGFLVRKSRLQGPTHANDDGGYRIVDAATNRVEWGERCELSLEDVERFLIED